MTKKWVSIKRAGKSSCPAFAFFHANKKSAVRIRQ
jgi:hypothetical protein